jgi:hypothetical protein
MGEMYEKIKEKRERKRVENKILVEQMNKRLSGKQSKVDYRPGDIVTHSDGSQYQVMESGAWKRIK